MKTSRAAADGAIQIHDPEADKFGDAKSGGVENVEHGVVAKADGGPVVGLGEKALDLFEAKVAGERAADLGRFEIERWIDGDEVLRSGKAKEVAQRDQMARDRAAFKLLAEQAGEEIHQVVAGDAFEGQLFLLCVTFELDQVAAVGRNRVGGQSLFHADMREKRRDGIGDFHQEPANPSAAPGRRMAMP